MHTLSPGEMLMWGMVGMMCMVGCAPHRQTPAVRSDTGPIASRLPGVGKIVKCRWLGGALGGDRGLVPGPTGTYIKGYAVIDEATWQLLKDAEGMVDVVHPPIDLWVDGVDKTNVTFTTSGDAFVERLARPGVVGDIYVAREIPIIWFSLEEQ